mmetsp:Transcript_21633/g.29793  ORF Transcript_21633/g.29793 Transcript_21633/m.29793 type:complete len:233 (-) Transcript_21633:38-736(-)
MSSKINESDDEDDDDVTSYQFKIILLGDGAVGKTSIASRIAEDKFSQNYKQTVGVDFFMKRLSMPPNIQIALQIWDIGGQSIGSKMITNYIAGADAVLLCYDITNYESFANLEDWYRLVIRTFHSGNMPYVALLGNKNDLKHLTAVRFVQHSKFAEENSMASFLMSAKSGDQVKQAFWKVACTLAGVPFVKFEQESQSVVVPATIIDHKRHDETVNEGKVPDYNHKGNCSLS